MMTLPTGSESCPEGAFPCANSSLCIPQRAICNQHNDCPLGDDENFITCGLYLLN